MKKKLHNKRQKILLIIMSFILVVAVLLTCNAFYCYNTIVVNKYSLTTDKLSTNLRVALIADLHLREFGKSNKELIEKLSNEKPDLIAVSGDLTLKNSTEYQVAVNLLTQLKNIAPTYYALGNHELPLLDTTNFEQDIRATGVHLLINQNEYFEKDGEKILVGGLKQYPYFDYDAPDFENPERYYLDDFIKQEQNHFGVLICHYPEYYMWKFNELNIDLMLAGHTHGGLVRIPGIGGLIAPEQWFFPKYDMGVFKSDTATMVVTSGLATSNIFPRINNPGEICIININ